VQTLLPFRRQQFFHYRFLVLGAGPKTACYCLCFGPRPRFLSQMPADLSTYVREQNLHTSIFLACCTARRQDPFLFLILSTECFGPMASLQGPIFQFTIEAAFVVLHFVLRHPCSCFGLPEFHCSVSKLAPGLCFWCCSACFACKVSF
jgi:hypothetical protein